MVMKFVLVLMLLISSAFAQKTSDGINKKIRQLVSMSNQKMGREKKALELWMSDRNRKMPKVSTRLLKTYFYLGTFHAQLYARHSSGEENKEDIKHYRLAKHYLEACAAYEHEIDKAEARLERLDQLKVSRAKKMKHLYWRALFQYLSYQELALLKDSGGEENIYSPQRGFCAGGQVAYGNMSHEWTMDACVYASSGNVGAENTARYFQKNVSSKGLYLKPGYWKLLNDGEAGIGVGVPLLLRTVDYTQPSGTSVKSRRVLPFGLSLDGRWQLTKKTHFTSTAALVDGSMLWSLGALYQF